MNRTGLLFVAALALAALLVPTGAAPFDLSGTDPVSEDIVLQPAEGPNGGYALVNEDDELELLLTDANPAVEGEGIGENTVTPIPRVFTMTYTGAQNATVWLTDDADDVRFYRGTDSTDSVEGRANSVVLGPSETVAVGLLVDTRGDHDVEQAETFTVNAEIADDDGEDTPEPTPDSTPTPDGDDESDDTPTPTPEQTPESTPTPEDTPTPEQTPESTPTPEDTPTPEQTPEEDDEGDGDDDTPTPEGDRTGGLSDRDVPDGDGPGTPTPTSTPTEAVTEESGVAGPATNGDESSVGPPTETPTPTPTATSADEGDDGAAFTELGGGVVGTLLVVIALLLVLLVALRSYRRYRRA